MGDIMKTLPTDVHEYQKIDYNYLRPLKSQLKRQIEFENVNKQYERMIYYDLAIPPNEQEFAAIQETATEVVQSETISIPHFWTTGDVLRYVACNDNNVKESLKHFERNLLFLKEIENFRLTDEAAELIKNGNIYMAGRCKDGIPIIALTIKGFKITKKTSDTVYNAFIFV